MPHVSVTVQLGTGEPGLIGPATSVSGLTALAGASLADGSTGFVRVGSGTDQTDLLLTYDASRGKWVSDETVLFRLTDNFGPKALFSAGWALGYSNTSAGYGVGAWSSSASVRPVADLWAAGLAIEYRSHAFITPDSSTGTPGISVFWNLYNVAPGTQSTSYSAKPPAAGWGQTQQLSCASGFSTAYYEYCAQDWTTLQAPAAIPNPGTGGTPSAPTNQGLYALIVGWTSGTNGNGRPIDALLAVRWVG